MSRMTDFCSTKLIRNPSQADGPDQNLVHKNGKTTPKNFLDITALIRSIQRSEGNLDCFGKSRRSCKRRDCAWFSYCAEFTDSFEK